MRVAIRSSVSRLRFCPNSSQDDTQGDAFVFQTRSQQSKLEDAMPVFPSVEWLTTVADRAMADDRYRRYGRVDALVGIKVGDQMYRLTFDVFDIRDIRQISFDDLRDLDFYLEM